MKYLALALAPFIGASLAVATQECPSEDSDYCYWIDPDSGDTFYSFGAFIIEVKE